MKLTCNTPWSGLLEGTSNTQRYSLQMDIWHSTSFHILFWTHIFFAMVLSLSILTHYILSKELVYFIMYIFSYLFNDVLLIVSRSTVVSLYVSDGVHWIRLGNLSLITHPQTHPPFWLTIILIILFDKLLCLLLTRVPLLIFLVESVYPVQTLASYCL